MNVFRKLATKASYNILKTALRRNYYCIPIKNKTGVMVLMSTTVYNNFVVIDEDNNENLIEEPDSIKETPIGDYTKQIANACEITEDKINELIELIRKYIEKNCEEYRSCLAKEIEILNRGMNSDPLSRYWDDMVKCRVEADNLKQEIIKFQSLVEYVGQVIFNLHICRSLLNKVEDKVPEIQRQFEILKVITDEQIELNKKIEKELLNLDRKHILNTPKT